MLAARLFRRAGRRPAVGAFGNMAHGALKAGAAAEGGAEVEMLEQQLIGTRGIAIGNGRQDAAVMVDEKIFDAVHAHDLLAAFHMGAAQQVRYGRIDDRQRRRVSGGHQHGMEGIIRPAAAQRVLDRLDDPLERGAKGIEIGGRGLAAGEPHGLALDCDACLHDVVDRVGFLRQRQREELAEHGEIRAPHHRAVAAADLHRTQRRQRAQSLAHDRAADPEDGARSRSASRRSPSFSFLEISWSRTKATTRS